MGLLCWRTTGGGLRRNRIELEWQGEHKSALGKRRRHSPLASQHRRYNVQPLLHAAERPAECMAPLRSRLQRYCRLIVLGWNTDWATATSIREPRLRDYAADNRLGQRRSFVLPSQRYDR